MFKLVQKQTYTVLSYRYSVLLIFTGIVFVLISALQFGEVAMEWSRDQYSALFNIYHDNIAGVAFQDRMCLPIPIDAVYTWVNGSDPKLLADLRKVKLEIELKNNYSSATESPGNKTSSIQCKLQDCLPIKLVVLDVALPSTMTVQQLSEAHPIFLHASRIYNITKDTGSVISGVEFGKHHEVDILMRGSRVIYLGNKNISLSRGYLTSDWTAEKSIMMKRLLLATGVGKDVNEETIRNAIPEEQRQHVSKIEIEVIAGMAILTLSNTDAAKGIISEGERTEGDDEIRFMSSYLIWGLEHDQPSVNEDLSASRFEDNEELRYSLRSLEKHAPWIRHVYIVTNGQIPGWLNLDNPRMTLVSHKEIFLNSSHLPSFSSPAIESNLHRIPGLSKKFIYLNDDTMFGKEVWPDDFYTHARGQKVYLTWPVPNCAEGCPSSWIRDNYCDKACNTSECEWDGGDCDASRKGGDTFGGGQGESYLEQMYCNSGCANGWIADTYCDQACNVLSCGFDAGDCGKGSLHRLQSYKINGPTNVTLPKGLTVVFFNVSTVFSPNGSISEGRYLNNKAVRTATVAQKFLTVHLLLYKNISETTLTFTIEGKVASIPVNVTFNVIVNTLPVIVTALSVVDEGDAKKKNNTKAASEEVDTYFFPDIADEMRKPRLPKGSVKKVTVEDAIPVLEDQYLTEDIAAMLKVLEEQLEQGDLTEKGFKKQRAMLLTDYRKSSEYKAKRDAALNIPPVEHLAAPREQTLPKQSTRTDKKQGGVPLTQQHHKSTKDDIDLSRLMAARKRVDEREKAHHKTNIRRKSKDVGLQQKEVKETRQKEPHMGQQVPVRGQQLPINGQRVSNMAHVPQVPHALNEGQGRYIPNMGQQAPIVEQQAPVLRKQVPNMGQEQNLNGQQVSNMAQQVPIMGQKVQNMGQQVPNMGQQAPDMQQQVPNMGKQVPVAKQHIPNMGQQLPDARQKVPNMGQPLPDARQKVPNMGQPLPNARQKVPNMGQPLPDARQKVPNLGQQLPDAGQKVPNIGQQLPDAGQKVPNMGQQLPDAGQKVPNMGQQLPDAGQKVLNMGQQLPDAGQKVPSMRQQLPDARQKVPNMGQQLPDARQKIPNMGQQLPDARQKIPNMGQQLPDAGQKVPQHQAHVAQQVPEGQQLGQKESPQQDQKKSVEVLQDLNQKKLDAPIISQKEKRPILQAHKEQNVGLNQNNGINDNAVGASDAIPGDTLQIQQQDIPQVQGKVREGDHNIKKHDNIVKIVSDNSLDKKHQGQEQRVGGDDTKSFDFVQNQQERLKDFNYFHEARNKGGIVKKDGDGDDGHGPRRKLLSVQDKYNLVGYNLTNLHSKELYSEHFTMHSRSSDMHVLKDVQNDLPAEKRVVKSGTISSAKTLGIYKNMRITEGYEGDGINKKAPTINPSTSSKTETRTINYALSNARGSVKDIAEGEDSISEEEMKAREEKRERFFKLTSFLPWERNDALRNTSQLLSENVQKTEDAYRTKGQTGRKLMDAFSDSLRFVSKLYNIKFGFTSRKVPAHMPHMIDVDIMNEVQAGFAKEFDLTSSHQVRHSQDMQFAFSYMYYIIGAPKEVNVTEVFDEFDTDGSGILSDREIRTLATRLYDLPLDLRTLTTLENIVINCSKYDSRDTVADGTMVTEKYYENKMPQVSKWLVAHCDPLVQLIGQSVEGQTKYRYEIMGEDDVSFKMIRTNVSQVIGQLDDIRKNPRKFICLNDNIDHSSEDSTMVKAVLQDFYESLFPKVSQFELPREYRNRFLHIDELREWRRYRDWLRFWTHLSLGGLILFSIASFCSTQLRAIKRRCCPRRRARSDIAETVQHV